MELTGNHDISAAAQTLWNLLMDPDFLARITPGITRMEKISDDNYLAIADVKIGPVKGSFKGEVQITEKQEPEAFTLLVQQKSSIGNVAASVRIRIQELSPEKSNIQFEGKAQLSGLLARTGQRVLSGVANTLSRQFFESLEAEIKQQV
jgi:carbon monoxide dehydrogenase subunit G